MRIDNAKVIPTKDSAIILTAVFPLLEPENSQLFSFVVFYLIVTQ